MKRSLGLCLVVCAVFACKKEGGGGESGKSPDLPPSRAAAAGDFADNQKVAKRWGMDLPPPTEQNGHRHWIVDEHKDMAALIALTKTEIVVSIGPRPWIDQNLAVLIGDQKPAKSLTTSQFKDIAQRDGFSAQGVGFVDTARMIDAVIAISPSADKPTDVCRAAINVLANGAPRLALGYDDLSGSKISFGVVAELSPDVTAQLKPLATTLAGVNRLLKSKPVMGMAAAVDLAQAKKLVPRIATVIRGVGGACKMDS